MNQPVTELGQRFSDPDAVAAGWDDTRRVLEAGFSGIDATSAMPATSPTCRTG